MLYVTLIKRKKCQVFTLSTFQGSVFLYREGHTEPEARSRKAISVGETEDTGTRSIETVATAYEERVTAAGKRARVIPIPSIPVMQNSQLFIYGIRPIALVK